MVTNGRTSLCKERYCSYEVAKLLKEKGFDGECHHVYVGLTLEWTYILYGNDVIINSEIPDVETAVITAPTHQMACDWLREVHHICITIYPDKEKGYEAILYNIESDVEITLQSFGVFGYHIFESSYEKAVEAALKYILELVEEAISTRLKEIEQEILKIE